MDKRLDYSFLFEDEGFLRRFWAKVDKTPGYGPDGTCWLWTGSKYKKGYGALGVYRKRLKKNFRAHKLAYEMSYGPVPKGKQLRHTCDVKACVNPCHIIPGTNQDNQNDAKQRGRIPRGEKRSNAKLSKKKASAIRADYFKRSTTLEELSKKYGVSISLISKVARKERWVEE